MVPCRLGMTPDACSHFVMHTRSHTGSTTPLRGRAAVLLTHGPQQCWMRTGTCPRQTQVSVGHLQQLRMQQQRPRALWRPHSASRKHLQGTGADEAQKRVSGSCDVRYTFILSSYDVLQLIEPLRRPQRLLTRAAPSSKRGTSDGHHGALCGIRGEHCCRRHQCMYVNTSRSTGPRGNIITGPSERATLLITHIWT